MALSAARTAAPIRPKSEWQTVRFGDVVAQVKTAVDPDASGLSRYVAGEHMDTDDLRIKSWGTIGDGYLGPAFHRLFRAGHVLYGSRRTYLRKVAVPDFDGICANTTFVCQPADDRALPDFLPVIMQLEAFHEHSIAQSKGSVNPYINWKDLAWFEFTLPPVAAQREIAAVLAATQHYIDASEAVADASLAAATTQFVAHALEGCEAPVVALADVLSASPESGCSAPERVEPTGHYVLGLQALTPEGYVPDQFKHVDPTEAMLAARLRRGDLLISRSNTLDRVGFAAIFDQECSNVSFPDTMMRLPVDVARAVPEYVARILMSPHGRKHIRSVAAGTSASMKKINRKGLGTLRFPLPSLQAQHDTLDAIRPLLLLARRAREAAEHTATLARALREDFMRP